MPYLSDAALDALLNEIVNNGEALHVCSQLPSTYTEATSTYSLGSEGTAMSPIQIGSPADKIGGGRKISVLDLFSISISTTGTASHWAIVDITNTTLLASEELSSPTSVTSGNTESLTTFDIEISDPS